MSEDYRAYVIREGDDLTRLAYEHEFDAQQVWADPKNAPLKGQRDNPDLLAPGDILYIPKHPKRTVPIKAGGDNHYQASFPEREISLNLLDEHQEPLANEVYEVTGGRPTGGEAVTDGAGTAHLTVPVPQRELSLYLPRLNLLMKVQIGVLNPPEEPSGLIQRLTNLGYLVSQAAQAAAPGVADVESALRSFQKDSQLKVTGRLDEATQNQLTHLHKQ